MVKPVLCFEMLVAVRINIVRLWQNPSVVRLRNYRPVQASTPARDVAFVNQVCGEPSLLACSHRAKVTHSLSRRKRA